VDLGEEIEREQNRRRLLELIQRVPPKLRAVLIADDLDHVPMREVARQLGIPVSTAYKWRDRGIAELAMEVCRSGSGLCEDEDDL
jgi:DNA-directed RNA polymerase specialized sigma24 family protein